MSRTKKTGLLQNHPGADRTPDEVELALAMDRYKREHQRPFPTWAEVLAVVKSLGYRKTEPPPKGA